MPSICFEHPRVHPQEQLYMRIYGISSSWNYNKLIINEIVIIELKKNHKTPCTSVPDYEHLDVRNMSKTLSLNYNIYCKKCAICWSLLHRYSTMHGFKKRKCLRVINFLFAIMLQMVLCAVAGRFSSYLCQGRSYTGSHRSFSPCGYICCNLAWTVEVLPLGHSYRTLSVRTHRCNIEDIPLQLEGQLCYLLCTWRRRNWEKI